MSLNITDMVGMPTFGGVLLADISLSPRFQQLAAMKTVLNSVIVTILFFSGMFLMSFPAIEPTWSPWYRFIIEDLSGVFPDGANLFSYNVTVGILLSLLGITISPALQGFFSTRPLLWLGNLSLPIYLVHGPLLRSVFLWMAYVGTQPVSDEVISEDGSFVTTDLPLGRPSTLRLVITLPIFLILTISCSLLWNRNVEPWCAKIAKSTEELCMASKEQIQKSDLLVHVPTITITHNREALDVSDMV
jgi:peptidoglycan/LPS O-acetylase OafA/YrhL